MNLRSTKLTVDRSTPRDRFATRFARATQISFPTSIRKSIDDSCIDFPTTPFYSPTGESFTRPRATSDEYWGVEAQIPHIPFAHLPPKYRYDHPDPPRSPTPIDFFHPPTPPPKDFPISTSNEPQSPALVQDSSSAILADPVPVTPELAGREPPYSIWIFDSSLREVDFDVACLDSLDEQLLYAPKDCFMDICWAEAVYDDEYQLPMLQARPKQKPRVRQPQTERETGLEKSERRYPDRIVTQMEHKVSFPSPESYSPQSPRHMMIAGSESRMLYQNANHSVHFFPVPQQRDSRRKRTAQDPPDTPSGKLKLFSGAYSTFTRRRRTTSN